MVAYSVPPSQAKACLEGLPSLALCPGGSEKRGSGEEKEGEGDRSMVLRPDRQGKEVQLAGGKKLCSEADKSNRVIAGVRDDSDVRIASRICRSRMVVSEVNDRGSRRGSRWWQLSRCLSSCRRHEGRGAIRSDRHTSHIRSGVGIVVCVVRRKDSRTIIIDW